MNESEIFKVATGLPPERRSAYLDDVCGGDSKKRDEIESLLRADGEADNFLEKPAAAMGETETYRPITESPGSVIGRYRLMEQIGEGGFGLVFVAEQQSPVRRKVALKIIKPGMDTKEVIARFEAERQALALMDHPNIAKVLDAGTTQSGRPYFVMELIRGIPILTYCDEKKLATQQRLELFLSVCRAVQHAHSKGIIHRDLKPGNVLVSPHDGVPMVKVIDFGIAKAIGQQLTDRTIYTRLTQMIGTPLYMSPEQAEINALDVDIRSDVYSLGVVLYELLTGATPFDRERFATATYEEIKRIIREEEPPTPSRRLSTLGDTATKISQQRETDPSRLAAMLRGELDWIVMRCLEKERTRRYQTASELASDLQRYLDNEPVEAVPPSRLYRAKKVARRHRVPLVIFASYVVLSLAAIFAIGQAAKKAETAHRLAERTIKEYHKLLIESALFHAASGDIEKVRATIPSAEDKRFPADWRLTLEGVAFLHQGENDQAIAKLEEARDRNELNVSARAMLALAYFHTGRWNDWVKLAAAVEYANPRDEFRDFDELFLAYSWFYSNPDRAETQLNATVTEHPGWIIPRVLLANLRGHQALFYEQSTVSAKKQRIAEALEMIGEIPSESIDDNPFLLVHTLFVYSAATRILADESGSLTAEAHRLSERLGKHPKYVVGALVRGSFYHRQGEIEKSRSVMRDVLKYGRGMAIHWPASALFLEGKGEEVVLRGHDWQDPEAKIARAYILALSENAKDREEAQTVFEELAPTADTWLMRHFLIQIPLLLQKPAVAEMQCLAWRDTKTKQELELPLGGWEEESIQLILDRSQPRPDPSSKHPKERFYANYQLALLDFANEQVAEAVAHLEECGTYDVPQLRWWVDGFKKEFAARIVNRGKSESIELNAHVK